MLDIIVCIHFFLFSLKGKCSNHRVSYKKGCTRRAAASDEVYQFLAHGQWFSLGTLASFTTKTGHHDIAEILLKVALKHQKSNHNQIIDNIYKKYAIIDSFCQKGFLRAIWTQKMLTNRGFGKVTSLLRHIRKQILKCICEYHFSC